MASGDRSVSVVIPTMALLERRQSLLKAVNCIASQEGVHAIPVVVVNGNRFDEQLNEELRGDARIRYLYCNEPSAPEAQLVGRRAVSTPYFAFLDDDDELLPGALLRRIEALEKYPEAAFAVENGYRHQRGQDEAVIDDMEQLNDRPPLESLLETNWMASCSGLFRTVSVGEQFFQNPAPYMEWTYLAFRLSLVFEARFLSSFGYRINVTENSVSSSESYLEGVVDVLTRMLEFDIPHGIAKTLRQKRVAALHNLSVRHLDQGDLRRAWRYHLRSVASLEGLRYLGYSRQFFLPSRLGVDADR